MIHNFNMIFKNHHAAATSIAPQTQIFQMTKHPRVHLISVCLPNIFILSFWNYLEWWQGIKKKSVDKLDMTKCQTPMSFRFKKIAWDFLVGMVVFRLMRRVKTPPKVSLGAVGVTSKDVPGLDGKGDRIKGEARISGLPIYIYIPFISRL